MKTHILVVILALALVGCAGSHQQIRRAQFGCKPYDPCVQLGESWRQLPNWEHEAIIRKSRCSQGIDTQRNCY
jgi:hypothetical protein